MTALPTEGDEVASALPALPPSYSLDQVRRFVRTLMRDESERVIDNVAESLYLRSRAVHFFGNPPSLIEPRHRSAPAALATPDPHPGDLHA
jgi:hypothetical protein